MNSHVDPDESVGFALKRLQQVLRGAMDAALGEHGLSTPQYLVLALLTEHPGSTNADLARLSFVSAPTMLRMVEALNASGLIQPVREPARDPGRPPARRRGYALTREGRRRAEAASGTVARFEDVLVSEAPPDQLGVIMEWMTACSNRLEQIPAVRTRPTRPTRPTRLVSRR